MTDWREINFDNLQNPEVLKSLFLARDLLGEQGGNISLNEAILRLAKSKNTSSIKRIGANADFS